MNLIDRAAAIEVAGLSALASRLADANLINRSTVGWTGVCTCATTKSVPEIIPLSAGEDTRWGPAQVGRAVVKADPAQKLLTGTLPNRQTDGALGDAITLTQTMTAFTSIQS